MESSQYGLEWVHLVPDFWVLSDRQLATSCLRLAQGRSGLLRAEALRLFLLWKEAMPPSPNTGAQREERACVLAALRRRTIQVLVRICAPQPERNAAGVSPRI
jgi:hypothetical protein